MVLTEKTYQNFQRVQEDIIRNGKAYREAFAKKAQAAKTECDGRKYFRDAFEHTDNNELYCFRYDKKLEEETFGNMVTRGDYRLEMQKRHKAYNKGVYTQGSKYDFATDVASVAYIYSSLYEEIVRGHEDGTRKRYQYDKEIGQVRELSLEEELALLDSDYEDYIQNDVFAAITQMHTQETLKHYGKPYIPQRYSREQVSGYIQSAYREFRRRYVEQSGQNPACTNSGIKGMVRDILKSNQGMFDYCTSLISQIEYIG